MAASAAAHDYTCTIHSARLLLEASGFTVAETHLNGRSPQTVEERDEVLTLYCTIVAILVLIAGLMSGLTLGLMSLDTLDLEVSPSLAWLSPASLKFTYGCAPICSCKRYLYTLHVCQKGTLSDTDMSSCSGS